MRSHTSGVVPVCEGASTDPGRDVRLSVVVAHTPAAAAATRRGVEGAPCEYKGRVRVMADTYRRRTEAHQRDSRSGDKFTMKQGTHQPLMELITFSLNRNEKRTSAVALSRPCRNACGRARSNGPWAGSIWTFRCIASLITHVRAEEAHRLRGAAAALFRRPSSSSQNARNVHGQAHTHART